MELTAAKDTPPYEAVEILRKYGCGGGKNCTPTSVSRLLMFHAYWGFSTPTSVSRVLAFSGLLGFSSLLTRPLQKQTPPEAG